MRVLLINVQIGSGSAGSIVSDLYKGFISNGIDCKIAFSRGGTKDVPESNTIRIGNRKDVLLHMSLTRVFGHTASYSIGATHLLLREIDKFNPDIIHVHGIYGYYVNMKLLFDYIAKKNIILVSTLHSCWDFTGHCCYFDFAGCEKWKEDCHKCIQKKSYPISLIWDNTKANLREKSELYHNIKRAVLVSPSCWMDELVSKSCLKDINHCVINNGIDLSLFNHKIDFEYNRSIGIDSKKATILSVASLWDKRKGLQDILEFADLEKSRDYNIVVVGLKDEQIKNLPENVIGIKRTDNREQLISLYAAATVLYNPTYEDNYPTVNLESIACGTPVITYSTGGSPETLKNKFGFVIESKDYQKLIQLVDSIKGGLIKFDFADLSLFAKEKMVDSYISLYNELIKK